MTCGVGVGMEAAVVLEVSWRLASKSARVRGGVGDVWCGVGGALDVVRKVSGRRRGRCLGIVSEVVLQVSCELSHRCLGGVAGVYWRLS